MERINNKLTRIFLVLLAALTSLVTLAQEGGGTDVNVDINKGNEGNWYTQPWVWIVGAAVFILLLVALMRSGKRRD